MSCNPLRVTDYGGNSIIAAFEISIFYGSSIFLLLWEHVGWLLASQEAEHWCRNGCEIDKMGFKMEKN